ncbi:MAG TPA: hypothetical protein VF950_09680 [Planctomycetota bacterium]
MHYDDRVKIWNSLLRMARADAINLHDQQSAFPLIDKTWTPKGGTLADDDCHALAMLTHLCQAAEARTNHMIEELSEERRITEPEAHMLKWASLKDRWFSLPRFGRTRKRLDPGKEPQSIVALLAKVRDDIFHVKFDGLHKKLEPMRKPELFTRFVEATFELNRVVRGEYVSPAKVRKVSRLPWMPK